MIDSTPVHNLLIMFRALAPWRNARDFSREDWQRYISAARLAQNSEAGEVERALAQFLEEADGFTAAENETRLFLLMRIMFDLPVRAPADKRHIFKGWVNWPAQDSDGYVNLSWPVDWQNGQPDLLASFEGADGPRYRAVEEYRDLLARFPLRRLG